MYVHEVGSVLTHSYVDTSVKLDDRIPEIFDINTTHQSITQHFIYIQ